MSGWQNSSLEMQAMWCALAQVVKNDLSKFGAINGHILFTILLACTCVNSRATAVHAYRQKQHRAEKWLKLKWKYVLSQI